MSELVIVWLQPPGPPTTAASDIDHPSIAPLPLVEKATVLRKSKLVRPPLNIWILVGVTEKSLRLSPRGALSVTKALNVPTPRRSKGRTSILVEPAGGLILSVTSSASP